MNGAPLYWVNFTNQRLCSAPVPVRLARPKIKERKLNY